MAQLLNSTAGEDCPAPPSDAPGVLHGFDFLLPGKRNSPFGCSSPGQSLFRKSEAPLAGRGPLGGRERIGTSIYERVSKAEGLLIRTPPDAGLIEHFNILRGPNFQS